MKLKKQVQSLTKAEEEIMQIIWQLEKCLVKDIIEKLGTPDIPHSTVSSVVRILEKKGFVTHKAYGKTYEYYPAISREDYATYGVKSLMEKYFGGSPRKLVSFLVKSEDIDLSDLNDLMKTLDDNSPQK